MDPEHDFRPNLPRKRNLEANLALSPLMTTKRWLIPLALVGATSCASGLVRPVLAIVPEADSLELDFAGIVSGTPARRISGAEMADGAKVGSESEYGSTINGLRNHEGCTYTVDGESRELIRACARLLPEGSCEAYLTRRSRVHGP